MTNLLKALCKFTFQAASRHFFGFHFNRNLDRTTLPGRLQTLAFGNDFNQSLDGVTLPPGLQTLTFGNDFASALVCMCVCMRALLSGFEEDGICRRGRWLAAPPWPATARAGCLAEGGVAHLPLSSQDSRSFYKTYRLQRSLCCYCCCFC